MVARDGWSSPGGVGDSGGVVLSVLQQHRDAGFGEPSWDRVGVDGSEEVRQQPASCGTVCVR